MPASHPWLHYTLCSFMQVPLRRMCLSFSASKSCNSLTRVVYLFYKVLWYHLYTWVLKVASGDLICQPRAILPYCQIHPKTCLIGYSRKGTKSRNFGPTFGPVVSSIPRCYGRYKDRNLSLVFVWIKMMIYTISPFLSWSLFLARCLYGKK